jgi:hypothetical protein
MVGKRPPTYQHCYSIWAKIEPKQSQIRDVVLPAWVIILIRNDFAFSWLRMQVWLYLPELCMSNPIYSK